MRCSRCGEQRRDWIARTIAGTIAGVVAVLTMLLFEASAVQAVGVGLVVAAIERRNDG